MINYHPPSFLYIILSTRFVLLQQRRHGLEFTQQNSWNFCFCLQKFRLLFLAVWVDNPVKFLLSQPFSIRSSTSGRGLLSRFSLNPLCKVNSYLEETCLYF